MHNIGWADIHAMSAPVAAGHINKCRHECSLSPVSTTDDELLDDIALIVSGLFAVAAKAFGFVGGGWQVAPRTVRIFNPFL